VGLVVAGLVVVAADRAAVPADLAAPDLATPDLAAEVAPEVAPDAAPDMAPDLAPDLSPGDLAGEVAVGTDAPAPDASDDGGPVPADAGVGADAAVDTAPPPAPGLVNPRTVPVTASTPLAVASGALLPASGASAVPIDTLLRIGFDATPTLGATGTIAIHLASDGSVVDSINIADLYAVYDGTTSRLTTNQTSSKVNLIGGLKSGVNQVRVVNYIPVFIDGNTATIIPHNNKLAYGLSYYVTIDDGVLVGTQSSTQFAGISAATAWTFTVKATAPTTFSVAADNSADFATVQGAIDAVPSNNSNPAPLVTIAPGVYQELLFIRGKNNITLRGSNNGLDTVIQYDNCDGFNPGTGGGQTVGTPGAGGTIPGYGAGAAPLTGGGRAVLLTSSASGLVLDSLTIKNLHAQGSRILPTLPASAAVPAGSTSAPTYVNYNSAVTQAETVYFNTTYAFTAGVGTAGTFVARHSNFISYQDTLQLKGFAWLYDCFVTGDTDFIWGNANTALFERCEIKSRNNPNGSSVVQSRAYLGADSVNTVPASFNTSYLGFVFLNCALTKEAGSFTAYLARSPGAVTVTAATPFLYGQYDIVSYIGCSMDSHIAPVGWSTSNPPGANVRPNPVTGWREYRSTTPTGVSLDVSQRLADPSPGGTTANPGGSLQLSDASAAAFFADRATILHGATDGTYTSTGLAAFNPTP